MIAGAVPSVVVADIGAAFGSAKVLACPPCRAMSFRRLGLASGQFGALSRGGSGVASTFALVNLLSLSFPQGSPTLITDVVAEA